MLKLGRYPSKKIQSSHLKLCLWAALIKFWFQCDLRRKKFSQFLQVGKAVTFDSPWSRVVHALCHLFMLWLVKIFQVSSCGKIYAASGNLFTDSRSWHSFVSSCNVFNRLFALDVQNEIQLLARFFCYSSLVCLLGFWLRNASLVKVTGNPISHGIVFTSLDV